MTLNLIALMHLAHRGNVPPFPHFPFPSNQRLESMYFREFYRSLALGIYFVCNSGAICCAAELGLKSGIDRSTFDLSVKPGDDFFQYVNGNWIKHNPIPPEYSRWGAFPKLRDDNLLALREILDDLSKQTETLTDERRKLRDFYRTAMDEPAIQRLGSSPLKPSLEKISKIDSANGLVAELGRLRSAGIDALFNLSVE